MDLLQAVSLWEGRTTQESRLPRVLFFTGCADEEFEAQARKLGAHGVVSKSSVTEELITAIRAVAGGEAWFGHIPNGPVDGNGRALRKALIAENDRPVRAALNALLPQHGYSASLAWKGEDVIQMLQQDHYDLLLLDHRLPGMMLGTSLFDQIERRWPGLPVVVLTGMPDATHYRPCENVRSAILKPVTAQGLQKALAGIE